MIERLEFTVQLPRMFLCGGSVLGAEFPVSIEGIDGVVAFPERSREKDASGSSDCFILTPPRGALADTSPPRWGYYYQTGDGPVNAYLGKVQMWLFAGPEKMSTLRNMWDGVNIWYTKFIQCLEIISGRSRTGYYFNDRTNGFQINHVSSTGTIEVIHHGTQSSGFVTASPEDYVSRRLVGDAIALANTNKELCLEYQLLLNAVRALGIGHMDTRKSILDSATAVEVCLTLELESLLRQRLGVSKEKDIMDKFQTLSGRFDLMSILGISLPDNNYKKELIDLRNKAVHAGAYPSIEQAKNAFEISKELIQVLRPNPL